MPDPTGFASLGLADSLVKAVASLGYEEPTPVQRETIPLILSGRDLLAQAATGTGKTAAFALPMLQRIAESPAGKRTSGLVLVATPGRALDHIRRKTLALDKLQILILDEADEMLDMGFAEDLDAILEATP